MAERDDLKILRAVLILVGVIFIAGIYPLMMIWPAGWAWHTGHSDYPLMIVGVYATLGVFLVIASRNPLENLSLIWFTVWSSLVHGHLVGDIPALLIIATVLAVLTPRRERARLMQFKQAG
jgi:hypothetical protein